MNSKLINPVWHSLNETHKKFAINYDGVQFYDPEICPFGAFSDVSKTANALNEYAKLTDSFFLVTENKTPIFDDRFVSLDRKIDGCQMVLQSLIEVNITENIVPLTNEHINEIYNLVWLVMPGYFKKRTFEMGNFFGIFKNNKLVSITGQRMQTNDFVEISAVVTHPEYTRRGYAKQLTTHVTKEIIKHNKHPILHTTKGNSAIPLYEKLGYKLTRDMNWWHFTKSIS
ncbi:GNAT family N-acetyltransferase [Tenacibaculum ovolyticum]|uniref:GNAT family N-acetyltransferase n=1 Tax=Tenacibaculum ovolyticum TaxID=104270 RepID=UPI00041CAD8E|nr:GNAT family N-acetyltransferase [Tenacibaculum ovolyticum]